MENEEEEEEVKRGQRGYKDNDMIKTGNIRKTRREGDEKK